MRVSISMELNFPMDTSLKHIVQSEGEHPLNSQKCGSEFLGVCLAGVNGDPLRSRLATFYFRTRRIFPQCGPDSAPTAR